MCWGIREAGTVGLVEIDQDDNQLTGEPYGQLQQDFQASESEEPQRTIPRWVFYIQI